MATGREPASSVFCRRKEPIAGLELVALDECAVMISLVDAVGVGAGLCSMASFVPQIVKIWRERDASTVSLRMFAVSASAFALWSLYGLLQNSWPLIAANLVCLGLVLTIVGLRLRFGGEG